MKCYCTVHELANRDKTEGVKDISLNAAAKDKKKNNVEEKIGMEWVMEYLSTFLNTSGSG